MLNEEDYNIVNLEMIFKKHSIMAHENHLKSKKKFKKEYPDEDLPDHLKEDFNISKALNRICQELIKLKNNVDDNQQS